MKQLFYILWAGIITSQISAYEEFLYPVDSIIHNGQEKFCVLHQKGNHLELWFWNPSDNSSIKGLLSSFIPAGLTVLPDRQGFSFIDNDRIRIKMVGKRSPKSVDLYGPYDLTTIHWIDSETFYFAAKERQHSNLFVATIDGDIFRLTLSNTYEYFYPQKVDDELFFIEKREKEYSILKAPYPTEKLISARQEASSLSYFKNQIKLSLEGIEIPYKPLLNLENAEELIIRKGSTIAFLSMKTNECGFFLEHPETVGRNEEVMEFNYHLLIKEAGKWVSRKLFSFNLPLHFLLPKRGKTRLYESILPLLPFYDDFSNAVYFLDYKSDIDILNVFSYDLATGTILQKTDGQFFGQSFFTPRTIQDRMFCGGSIVPGVTKNGAPSIEIDNQGIQYFTFCQLE